MLDSPPSSEEAYKYGKDTSLLWLYFVYSTAQASVKDEITRLYFLTREGEFFLQIWDKLAESLTQGSNWPPASLLEVSRVSTFGPAVISNSSGTLEQLFLIYKKQTLYTLLKSLNCYDSEVERIVKTYSISLNEPLKFSSLQSTLQDLLKNKELTDYVFHKLNSNKEILVQYLLEQGWDSNVQTNLAVVDIGWHGSIQENLSKVFNGRYKLFGYYFGLKKSRIPPQKNLIKRGIVFNQGTRKDFRPLSIFQPWDVSLIEMMTTSGKGSVKGYKEENGSVLPLRPVNLLERKSFLQFSHFYQEGVLDGLEYWIQLINSGNTDEKKLLTKARSVYQELCFNPPRFVKQAFVRYIYEDEYGLGKNVYHETQKLNNSMPLKYVLKSLCTACGRKRLKEFARSHKDIYSLDSCAGLSSLDRLVWKVVLLIANSFYIYVLKR